MDCSKAISILDHKIRPTKNTIADLIQWFKAEN